MKRRRPAGVASADVISSCKEWLASGPYSLEQVQQALNALKPTLASEWARCRYALRCAYGCAIQRGEWVRWGRNQTPICASCAERRYGLKPPSPVFGCGGDAPVDVRDRQVGEES